MAWSSMYRVYSQSLAVLWGLVGNLTLSQPNQNHVFDEDKFKTVI